MSEKNVKARIVHKHDTQANWEKATGFIPMKGELIVYDIDSNYSYERFKIGDGATNVNALPFFAAGALTSEGLEQVKGVKVDNATSADSANKTVGTFTVNGVAFDGSSNKSVTITVPDELADLAADSTHRVVTDAQISAWNAKSNFSGAYADLSGKPTIYTDVVRYGADQSLSDTQKSTARNNIDVYSKEEVYINSETSLTVTWDKNISGRDMFKIVTTPFRKVSEPLVLAAKVSSIEIGKSIYYDSNYYGEGVVITNGVAIIDAPGTYTIYEVGTSYTQRITVPSAGIYFYCDSTDNVAWHVETATITCEGRALPEDISGIVKTVNNIEPDGNGNVNVSLDGFATEEYVDGKVSEATAGSATEEYVNNAVSGLASTEYVDGKIDLLVGEGASTTLDTIGEISKAIEAHQDVTDALNSAIGTKANASDLTAHTGNTSNPHGVTKAQVGLGNVENKSSATIRSEITSVNVTDALGYSPVKTVNNIEPDENGNVQIEIPEGFSGSWNDLTDRPFGEETATVNEIFSITWDGNTEGLITTEKYGYTLYRVSDTTPSYTQLKEKGYYEELYDGQVTRHNFSTSPMNDGTADMVFQDGVPYLFVYTSTEDRPAGIYLSYSNSGSTGPMYCCKIATTEPVEYAGMTVKTIDPKYLPEMEAEQKQADFDQEDDTQPDYIKNKNIFKDHIILVDQANSYEYVVYIENGNLITCRKYDHIEVTSMPETTQYTYGSAFDSTGMVVEIIDQDGVAFVLDNDKLNIDMHEDGIVDITYKYGGITYTTQITVTVGPFDPEVALIDFVYTTNADGTYTITDWKGTTNGVAGTKIIIPNNTLIKL